MDPGRAAARRPGMTEWWGVRASFLHGGFAVERGVSDWRLRLPRLRHVGGRARTLGGVVLQRLLGATLAAVGAIDLRIGQRGRAAGRRRELAVDLRARLGRAAGGKLVEDAGQA